MKYKKRKKKNVKKKPKIIKVRNQIKKNIHIVGIWIQGWIKKNSLQVQSRKIWADNIKSVYILLWKNELCGNKKFNLPTIFQINPSNRKQFFFYSITINMCCCKWLPLELTEKTCSIYVYNHPSPLSILFKNILLIWDYIILCITYTLNTYKQFSP